MAARGGPQSSDRHAAADHSPRAPPRCRRACRRIDRSARAHGGGGRPARGGAVGPRSDRRATRRAAPGDRARVFRRVHGGADRTDARRAARHREGTDAAGARKDARQHRPDGGAAMTELEDRECADGLGAYALGALSQDEAERVRRHIERCPTCRDELDGLRAAVDALPASVEQIEPPRELKQRLMAIVEAEAELLRAAGDAADRPAGEAARPRGRRWLAAPRWRPATAFGLACAIAVAVIVLSAGGAGPRTI